MRGVNQFIRDIWILAAPYFRSEDRWAGRVLLAAVIAIELAIVAITVLINQWNARFFNAIQERDWDKFVTELSIFCLLAAIFVVLAVYQLYLNQWLQIRWRSWMTHDYVQRWLAQSSHYRMQLLGDAADNPDQRIADDINQFIEKALLVGVRLLGAIVTFFSFIAILWGLSSDAPLTLFGTPVAIPGYLVWAALLYSVIGTLIAHWIGWPLAAINFQQQRFEADFRFNLIRVRENSEQVALLRGEAAENERLGERFARVAANFYRLMSQQKRVIFVQQSHAQAAVVIPYIIVSPAYFAGAVQLGGLTQTASAFGSVQESLSFFVTFYRNVAEWAAVVARLSGFNRSLADAVTLKAASHIKVETQPDAKAIALDGVAVHRPNGTPLLAPASAVLKAGEDVLLTGPSGAGKSTLFRTVAGLWPFGEGQVSLPADARIMLLPQRPYFPVTTLANALSYPADSSTFDESTLIEALQAVGLPVLTGRLHDEEHWNKILSPGEQQRLGMARALLQRPDFLFLDEATASLDEAAEAQLYGLLRDRLPSTTIISIGHRSTLQPLHDRHLRLHRAGEAHLLVDQQASVPDRSPPSLGPALPAREVGPQPSIDE